jgi:hypothetical protein
MDLDAWRRAARFVVLMALGMLSGCASTPDFKPFATETATLGGAIDTEQSEVVSHFTQTINKAEQRGSTEPRTKQLAELEKDRAKYKANAAAVNAVMDLAVAYSNALADLAAAGQTGPDAVNSLTDTVKGFSSALNIALPGAGAIPAWASALAKEIANAVTQIQAAKGLAEATKVADPTIKKIGTAIADLYAPNKGPQVNLAAGLQAEEEGILQDLVGRHRIAFYRGINVTQVTVDKRSPDTRLEYFFADVDQRIAQQSPTAGICGLAQWAPVLDSQHRPVTDKNGEPVIAAPQGNPRDDPNCLTGQTLQSLQAVEALLAGLEPSYQRYMDDLSASRGWLEQRNSAAAPIADAALKWTEAHAKLAQRLEECGGLRSLHASCGNLTFANLKLAVERAKSLAGAGGK